jgi:hypothetical protein
LLEQIDIESFWLDGPASAVHAFELTIIRYEIRGALLSGCSGRAQTAGSGSD